MIGPPEAIAEAVLKHKPLSVALLILHLEWMTQRHFIECIRDDQGLDPQFASMLRHHWMEEAQHAMLDTLMVAELAKDMPEAEIVSCVDGYLEIGGMIDDGLKQQALFDLAALMKASGRQLGEAEHAEARRAAAPGPALDLHRVGHEPSQLPRHGAAALAGQRQAARRDRAGVLLGA